MYLIATYTSGAQAECFRCWFYMFWLTFLWAEICLMLFACFSSPPPPEILPERLSRHSLSLFISACVFLGFSTIFLRFPAIFCDFLRLPATWTSRAALGPQMSPGPRWAATAPAAARSSAASAPPQGVSSQAGLAAQIFKWAPIHKIK